MKTKTRQMVKLQKLFPLHWKLLTLTLTITLAGYSNAKGVGEYHYGADVSEAFACQVAEERAKEDLIVKNIGETIDHLVEKNCVNEECRTESQTFRFLDGRISKITSRTIEKYEYNGYNVCQVVLNGKVSKIASPVKITINSRLSFRDNDTFSVNFVSNTSGGDFFLFNLYNDRYVKVYHLDNVQAFKETTIPRKGHFKAIVPEFTTEVSEKLLFLHTLDKNTMKDEYTIQEMNAVLLSLSKEKYGAVNRFITVRK